ncbi:MAG TPA: hypothetical protein VL068_10030, partial [Microthrixaceae bacterium]|nr:hypothetical protein [Microthrixaceae bacterium]
MDIFVRDLAATTTSRVSVSTAGAQGDGDSQRSSISSDGRYIAFDSYSENFVSDELKGTPNVFVHDREVGTTTLVSATPELSPSDGVSVGPKISADGGSIAYRSTSADLVVGGSDPNNGFQVFVYDRETASTILVSAASATNEAVESTEEVAISADGGVISYTGFGFGTVWSDPLPSADIYVWVRRS